MKKFLYNTKEHALDIYEVVSHEVSMAYITCKVECLAVWYVLNHTKDVSDETHHDS